MNGDLQQLVLDAVDQTGATPPAILDSDAPVFSSTRSSIYLIGLIGGKDVGKSSLVNALVGQPITAPSSFGEGTDRVIAYAHEDAAADLRKLLDREPFQLITHRNDDLRQQVLLDLPDIDSRWTAHVQLTRRMLRHMLYPIWIQSIEKYADQQPQELLRQVAAGNDPANFIFCLNKADQLEEREAQQIREDFAARISAALKMPQPTVHLISAINPSRFDLPALRTKLANQKSTAIVEQSVHLAARRKNRSMLDWLDDQQLPQRAARAKRSLRDAQEIVAARIASPLLEDSLRQVTSDPAYRLGIIDPVVSKRLSRWPVVNMIQLSLAPLSALVRKNLSASSNALNLDARACARDVQTTFAQLRQSDPTLAALYDNRGLWEDLPAENSAADLSSRLRNTIQRQRIEAVRKLASRGWRELFAAPIRWLLTIGAILWFPLAQPILQRVLEGSFTPTLHDLALLIVPLLGASYLLHSAAVLIIYFLALWMLLRWNTHRRANRLIARWNSAQIDSEFSLHGQVASWIDQLLEPLSRSERDAMQLAERLHAAKAISSD